MAIVKQCDRCGKIYNHYPMSNSANIYNALKRVRTNPSNTGDLTYSLPIDMCRECMIEFDKFINMSDMKYAKKNDPLSKEENENDVEF